MSELRQRPAAPSPNRFSSWGCQDETELAELLTKHVHPRGITGHIVDVVQDGEPTPLEAAGRSLDQDTGRISASPGQQAELSRLR